MNVENLYNDLVRQTENNNYEEKISDFLCRYTSRKSAVCCGGAESGLDIVLCSMGIGKGDAVFISSMAPNFVLTSVLKSGAHIIFCDVTRENPGIDHYYLERAVRDVFNDGRYEPRAVIMSDTFGFIPRVNKIEDICRDNGLILIEDASEGLGGSFDGARAGSFGDVSVVGFNNRNWRTFGGAGAVLTDDEQLAFRFSAAANGGVPINSEDNSVVGKGTYSKINPVDGIMILNDIDGFDLRRSDFEKRAKKAAELIKNNGRFFKFSDKYSPAWTSYPVIFKTPEARKSAVKVLTENGFEAGAPYSALPVCSHPAVVRRPNKISNYCSVSKGIYENIILVK